MEAPKTAHEILAAAVLRYLEPPPLPTILPAGVTPEQLMEREFDTAREHMRLALANYHASMAIVQSTPMAALVNGALEANREGRGGDVARYLDLMKTIIAFGAVPVAAPADVTKALGEQETP